MHASRHDLAFHLSVQDLSPILPGPIAQDAALVALRQAVLQCISDMARRVGDSLHLLEALGGIVGKLPGPKPLTTAVLECVASAAMAVNYFSPKVCCCCWRCLIQIMRAAGSRLMDSFPFASYAFLLQDHTSSNGQVHPHLWPCESANLVYAFLKDQQIARMCEAFDAADGIKRLGCIACAVASHEDPLTICCP